METIKNMNEHDKNILGKRPSINTSTCKCQTKEACLLNRECQIGEAFYEDTLFSNLRNYKEKNILESQKNYSKDAYTTTIYLSEMNFTAQNFLTNTGK